MNEVIVYVGLPASGKSTMAKKIRGKTNSNHVRVNKDDLRAMHFDKVWKGNEGFIEDARDALIRVALQSGKNVIVDDTNLHPKHIETIRKIAQEEGASFRVDNSFLSVSLAECIERDAARPNGVGKKVIKSMHDQFLKKEVIAPYHPDLADAVICDLDGTLALLGDRDVYDASRCDVVDTPNPAVVAVLKMALHFGHPILFCSGRESKDREPSIRFIKKALPDITDADWKLFMRATGDGRKDSIVKQELYDANIKDKYNVLFVLDDRNQVVDFWRSIGLPTFQVAEGDF